MRTPSEPNDEGYCDQPYVVITKDGNWLCVLTTGAGHEPDAQNVRGCVEPLGRCEVLCHVSPSKCSGVREGGSMKRSFLLALPFVFWTTTAAAARPNVVMIIADDQTFTDFGFMGNDVVRTPNLDRLAKQSACYTAGYMPSSVCRPSLATLLTGLYPHEHGIHFNHPPPGNSRLNRMASGDYYAARAKAERLIAEIPALPRILARHGYDSLQTGKFWEGHYRNAGFTHGMTTGRAAGVPGCWDKTLPDGVTVAHGNGDVGLTIGRKTMEPIRRFLDDHTAPNSRPFLLWYAPVLPHEPHNAAEKYLGLYRDQPDLPTHFVHYYAACTWFDDTVGQLLEMLDERSQLKNTLFLFVVDNGWTPSANAHPKYPGYAVDKRSKRSPFDRGLRTPILIRWDGHVRSATHTVPCSGVDVVPTILSALGLADKTAGMSGIDLMPSALGHESLAADRAVFGEIYPGDASTLGNPAPTWRTAGCVIAT